MSIQRYTLQTLLLAGLSSVFNELQAYEVGEFPPPPYTLAQRSGPNNLGPISSRDFSINEADFSAYKFALTAAAGIPDSAGNVFFTRFGGAKIKFRKESFLSEIAAYEVPRTAQAGFNDFLEETEAPFNQIGMVVPQVPTKDFRGTAYCAHSPNLAVTAAHVTETYEVPVMFKTVRSQRVVHVDYNQNDSLDGTKKPDVAVLYPSDSTQRFIKDDLEPFSLDISNEDIRRTIAGQNTENTTPIFAAGVTKNIIYPVCGTSTTIVNNWVFKEYKRANDVSWQYVTTVKKSNKIMERLYDLPSGRAVNGTHPVTGFDVRNDPLQEGASGGPIFQIRNDAVVAFGTHVRRENFSGNWQPTGIRNQYWLKTYVSRIQDVTKMCNSARHAMWQLKPLRLSQYSLGRPTTGKFTRFTPNRGFGKGANDSVTIPIDFNQLMTYIGRSQEIRRNQYVFDPGEFVSEVRVAKIAANGEYVPGNEHLNGNYDSNGHLVLNVKHKNVHYTSTGTLKIGDIWRQYPCPSGSGQNKEKGGVPLQTRGLSGSIWPDLSKLKSLTGQFFDIRGSDVTPLNTNVTLTVILYLSSPSPPPTSSLGLTSMQYEIVPSYQ